MEVIHILEANPVLKRKLPSHCEYPQVVDVRKGMGDTGHLVRGMDYREEEEEEEEKDEEEQWAKDNIWSAVLLHFSAYWAD